MNPLEFLVSSEFIRAFAWTLFHSLWQGGLVALLAAGIMMILRKHRPVVRYTILYILMVLLPVFFIGTFLVIYNPANANVHHVTQVASPMWQSENSLAGNLQAIPVAQIPQAWYAYLVHLFENQAKWLVLLWFTGFLIFLIRFSGSFIYIYRLKNHQVYPVDEQWNAILLNLSKKIKMHRKVKLAESALARIPLTIGYLKPVILLPLGTLSGVPPQQIDAILLHELAHILRKDYILNIIQSLIELMFFYHPVTWWLTGMIRQEREHICDDLAVEVNQDHLNYIKALTTMEELNSKSPFLASAITGTKKKLLLRVKRLLSPVKLRKGFSEGMVAFILLTGLIFALSLNALSFIPNAYDLTGRESGEKVYSLLNTDNNIIQVQSAAEIIPADPEPASIVVAENPDTIVAKSKSGKVVISVYTDSTDATDAKELNVFVETLDKNIADLEQARNNVEKEVIVVRKNKVQLDSIQKIVFIKSGDSVQVIQGDTKFWLPKDYDTSFVTEGGMQFYGFDIPEFSEVPDLPDLENLDHQLFSYKSDSLDTLIFMGPDGHLYFDNKELEMSSKEWENHMKDLQMNIEDIQHNAEKQQRELKEFYRDHPGDIQSPEPFYYNFQTPVPPSEPQWNERGEGHRIAPAERIIRQELIDDGLASPNKKYVIDVNSKGMYINGEKQSKEVFRKYKHLVESLDLANFEGEDTYRLIF